ncbi:hypothetical protein AMELA_G00199460 [Ameiurus melas]|uniref:UPAR/Ly6 domain-containing protein n=1 Tax=Ameiurus melas TaxID=219545 RepID=A0A7J6A8X9_AMEME|nr:hypothetical protein AMELA_G00199460 [Ameiurus melas]
MKFPGITLFLICTLFSEVLSLVCQYSVCLSGSGQCKSTEINCPNQCVSITSIKYTDGKSSTKVVKTCGTKELCLIGSVNLGDVKVAQNAKCCNTTLCNTETLADLPKQRANGKMCYSCTGNDCSQTVDCEGNESQCISHTVNQLGKTVTMKGCSDKSTCNNSTILNLQGINAINNQCCQGNLCNGVQSVMLSFQLVFFSLLSSTLFY